MNRSDIWRELNGAAVRSLDDSELFHAMAPDGQHVALKIARDTRPGMAAMLAHEARVLQRLGGEDSPRWLAHGEQAGRAYLAMTWCSGVSVGMAAQALRASRDRRGLHGLVHGLLQAYGRLHERGMLHGDIHPGNCMVGDDGRIVTLDFGHSRSIGDAASEVDIARAGIPQFYDPQMAQALRAGALAPAASPASEQYAIAALAYLLLTGLHPIDSPAVQDELLRRIAERPPLSFAARGVTSWPAVEGVLRRALAPQPEHRFSDLTKMAQAFAAAGSAPGTTQRPASLSSGACEPAFKACLASVRRLAPEPRFRRDRAWFALRAAVALEDAELLAVAGCLAARADSDPQACMVAAKLAQAHSDVRAEGRAIAIFLDKARGLAEGMATLRALLAAARILEAGSSRCTEATALAAWATQRLRRLCQVPRRGANPTSTTDTAIVLAALALAKTGRVEAMPALQPQLEALRKAGRGNLWLWALAHDVFADDRFRTLALSARIAEPALARSFAQMRRYQLTGETRWLTDARRAAAGASSAGLPQAVCALLAAELRAPESASPPPFASLFGVPLRWQFSS